LNKIKIYGISIPICLVFVSLLINSSNAQSSNQSDSLEANEQRQYEKFLEQGEEAFEKECLKSLNIDNEYAEDFLDYMPKDLSKDVCEKRISKFKNLTGTSPFVENQTSTSAGQVTYDTYNDITNGFSLEYHGVLVTMHFIFEQ
jgi:hypothetical protein